MNMELIKFTSRSLESVKGQRKRPDHKQQVQKYVRELRSGNQRARRSGTRRTTRAAAPEPVPSSQGEPSEASARRPAPSSSAGQASRRRRISESDSDADASVDDLFEDAEPGRESDLPPDVFTEYFAALPTPDNDNDMAVRLHTICRMTSWRTKEEVLLELSLFLKEIFPDKSQTNRPKRQRRSVPEAKNRIIRRREEYKRVQDLWRKNKSTCIRRILNEDLTQDECLPRELMEPFWTATFTQDPRTAPILPPPDMFFDSIWTPIKPMEIKGHFPPHNTSAGLDGVKVEDLKKMPLELLARIFNLLMWCGKLPEHLCASRTIFLPKKKGVKTPGEFRPITMTSVLVRTFHKVLAERLKVIPLDSRQRGFREADGCAENVMLLDMTLKYHQEKRRKMFLAILDMAKAFDSVAFEAMRAILDAKGIPAAFTDYFMGVLEDSYTVLQHGDWQSGRIHPTCGVKQGDPLSPLIFNFVMDEMLRRLPGEIGVSLDGLFVNAMAFADDLSLVASTKEGLQALIDGATSFLGSCGLHANPLKCATLALKTIPKEKKTAVDPSCRFKIQNAVIPALTRTDEWVYLGINFTANGRKISDAKPKLTKQLELLTKAPLKPQQRIWALRVMVIPGLLYQGALGQTTVGYLRSLDCMIRGAVRRWLRLPGDCPNGYFHAYIEDGGLGIQPIRYKTMLDRLARLQKLMRSSYIVGLEAGKYLERQISIAENRLKDAENRVIKTNTALREFLREFLYRSVDGRPLSSSSAVGGQHRWVGEPTRFLSGADYINCIRARIAALPTASRVARGRLKEKRCRAGCGDVETLNHVLQFCHRTHDSRLKRHDAVVSYIRKGLEKKGYAVSEEPEYLIEDRKYKPDLVATKEGRTVVVDAQVLGDQRDMRLAHEDKIRKYGGVPALRRKIREATSAELIKFTSVTLNWRGLWSKDSVGDLLQEGIIMQKDVKTISSRVLIGALSGWRMFNRRTGVASNRPVATRDVRRWRRERVGVG